MDFNLKGKQVLITGGAHGIGKATAKLFSHENAKVIIADLLEKEGREVAQEINGEFIKLDISEEKNWIDLQNKYPEMDIVINNAGIMLHTNIENASLNDWQKTLFTNLYGMNLGCKYALKAMESKKKGVIVNVASSLGKMGMNNLNMIYQTSKAAIIHYTKLFALNYSYKNIRCNAILPGPIQNTFITDPVIKDKKIKSKIEDVIPMKNIGKPEQVANAILFIASDCADYITGSELAVDGGSTAGVIL